MRRRHTQETEGPGHDSFLDIVANIVGILIILVMVTGVRAKTWSAQEPPPDTVPASAIGLQKVQAAEFALRREVSAITEQQRQLERETEVQNQARLQLATAVSAIEREIAARSKRLDAASQEDFRLRREIAETQAKLDRAQQELQMSMQIEAAPTQIESYPTPLGKTVHGDEIHFQLKGGQIAHIPLEGLLDRFKRDAQRKMYKLRDVPELTDTVGPEGGFRLRYTVVRRDVSMETQVVTGGSGSIVQLEQWTLIPVTDQLGEPVDRALADGSRFREVLASFLPDATTVTIWTYPDSFAEFRRLKKELFRMGFPTAGRPLPEGVAIGGSPLGTRSSAE